MFIGYVSRGKKFPIIILVSLIVLFRITFRACVFQPYTCLKTPFLIKGFSNIAINGSNIFVIVKVIAFISIQFRCIFYNIE